MLDSTSFAVEDFRALVCRALPGNVKLEKTPLSDSLKLAWQKLAGGAGLSIPEFTRAVAAGAGLEVADSLQAKPELIRLFKKELMQKAPFIPLSIQDGELSVAIANPADDELLGAITHTGSQPVRFLLAPPEDIEEALFIAISTPSREQRLSKGLISLGQEDQEGGSGDDEHATSRLAKKLLRQSILLRSSDLHIQPFMGGGVARARVDGLLRRIALLPEQVYTNLSRYIKVQGGMDPANSRIPQDGRMSISFEDHDLDLRISALPSRGGERIVIRFLDQNRKFYLSRNGFSVAEVQALRRLSSNSSGLVVITGPTGSGKTSTLYSLLGELNTADRNIITVENPVEYVLTGISQVEVNEKAGLTFSSVLRSTLRQDPDVILVGEIRDEETADIAFQAALTGHLVFSTLHTNDAITTIPRLLDLGIRPSILADALAGIVAQRLCRKLCVACRKAVTKPLSSPEQLFKTITRIAPPYRPMGCEACGFTGYLGRVPITEIIEPSKELHQTIYSQETKGWYEQTSCMNCLNSLASSAARHVISGVTSVTEAARVLGLRFWSSLSAEYGVELPDGMFMQQEEGAANSPGILILGHHGKDENALVLQLEQSLFSTFRAYSAKEAKKFLEIQDNIVLVIVDIDERMENEKIVAFIHHARTELAWSRLPALLLLPSGREKLQSLLLADGATSKMVMKPITGNELANIVRTVLSSRK